MGMNPALMKYAMLQQLAQQQQQPEQYPQPQQELDPDMELASMFRQGTQQGSSPIGTGAIAGMKAAKSSLEMDGTERRKAFGHALMQAASVMSKPGYGSGLAGGLAAINAAMGPASSVYRDYEGTVANRNAHLLQRQDDLERQQRLEQLKQIELAHQMQNDMDRRELEREAFEHEKGYKSQYLDVLRAKAQSKAGGGNGYIELLNPASGEPVQIDVSGYTPITTSKQKNDLHSDKDLLANSIQAVDTALKQLEEFEEEAKNDKEWARPDREWTGGIAAKAKDISARAGKKDNHFLREKILRTKLADSLAGVQLLVESAARNNSTPTQQMMNGWDKKGLSARFEQGYDVTKSKLEEMRNKLLLQREANQLSSKSGYQIDAIDLLDMKKAHGLIPMEKREEDKVPHRTQNGMQAPGDAPPEVTPAEFSTYRNNPKFSHISDDKLLKAIILDKQRSGQGGV